MYNRTAVKVLVNISTMQNYAKHTLGEKEYARLMKSYNKGIIFSIIYYLILMVGFFALLIFYALSPHNNHTVDLIIFLMIMGILFLGFYAWVRLYRKIFAKEWYDYTQLYQKQLLAKNMQKAANARLILENSFKLTNLKERACDIFYDDTNYHVYYDSKADNFYCYDDKDTYIFAEDYREELGKYNSIQDKFNSVEFKNAFMYGRILDKSK